MEDSLSEYDEIYKKYEWFIYKIANKYLNNNDDSQEVGHEVWIAYLKAINSGKIFESEIHRRNWLARVAYYIAIKEYSKKLRYDCVEFEEYMKNEIQEEKCDNPKVEMILEEYEKLKPKYKEIFELYYFQRLKILEISKLIHISENAVKKRLERSRTCIKNAIAQKGL